MICVQAFNTHPRYHAGIKETIFLATVVLRKEGARNAELSVVFINDTEMIAMNGRFLKHRYATDVLSFSLADNNRKHVEGEVYVNMDQARRQAKEYGVSIKNEIARLVIHGILHLVGFQDNTRQGKKRMTVREDYYLDHIL